MMEYIPIKRLICALVDKYITDRYGGLCGLPPYTFRVIYPL